MSGLIPKNFITSLLARCDIVELIDARLPLRKKGKNYVACCPFHQESTPSFTVTPDKQFYHCFGCSESGNAISFVMAYERLGFVEAVELLAARLGLTIPHTEKRTAPDQTTDLYRVMEHAVQFYQQQLAQSQEARAYLTQRGITEASIQQFKLGFAPAAWTTLFQYLSKNDQYSATALQAAGLVIAKEQGRCYDRFRSRIIFPIRDRRGRYIGLGGRALPGSSEPKYLNSPETPIFQKGSALYGLYEACQQRGQFERIWVVEGYMDVLALVQQNIPQVVATLGTATSNTHLLRLFDLTQELVFCFDGDAAGQKAAWRALETSLGILRDGWMLRFLFLPEGEDPDSWVQQKNHRSLEALLAQALSLSDFLFQQLQKDSELNSAEGKARLARDAFPLLNKIPPSVMRQQLFERLARTVGVELTALSQLMKREIHHPAGVSPSRKPLTTLRTPVDRAVACLLQYPTLAKQFTIPLQLLKAEDYPVLVALFQLIQQYPEAATGIVLEHFRDQAIYAQLVQLARHEWLIPENGIHLEFQDILQHLQKATHKQRVDKLLQKAKQGGLTVEEKQQLNMLISIQKSP